MARRLSLQRPCRGTARQSLFVRVRSKAVHLPGAVLTFRCLRRACFFPLGRCHPALKPFDLASVLVPEGEVAPETLDPLELHFRKMTEFPLLSHERELDLARRLERADLSITRALLASK